MIEKYGEEPMYFETCAGPTDGLVMKFTTAYEHTNLFIYVVSTDVK